MKRERLEAMIVFYVLIICIFVSATYLGSEVTTTIAQKIPMERENTLIIDAGHGGVDGGATSCTGILESQYNLEIAIRLNDLMRLLGYDTKMIRTTDISVYTEGNSIAQKKISDLKERVRIVNDSANPVLISIHQNTFSDSRYSGAQIFYGPKGEGQALATGLQSSFCKTLNPGSNRKSKAADGIYLMQHIHCTGILVECGFLSNPQEEAQLRSPEYQKKLCCVLASGLSIFLDQ